MDFGSKWIGLAVGETEHGIASPCGRIAASGALKRDAQAIAQVAKEQGTQRVAMGNPLDVDGGPTPMSGVCSQLAKRLSELGLEVTMVDERLTSVESHAAMTQAGLKGAEQKRKKDSEAAARILERLFQQGGNEA